MKSTDVCFVRRRPRRRWTRLVIVGLAIPLWGCQELVHMGHLSDREAGFAVGNARIEQQQEDGSWKLLGKTDGNGKWWIMKETVRSDCRIRITKSGYYPLYMGESEFLQEYNLLMIPEGGGGDWTDDTDGNWGRGS